MSVDAEFPVLILFQLKISLNKERPDLKMGTGWDEVLDLSRWGVSRSGIKNVSNEIMRLLYTEKISNLHLNSKSIFGSNIHRALRSCLGDVKCFQTDPLSLSGYCFDFEILLDHKGSPINIPILWKYKSQIILRSSVGVKEDVKVIRNHVKYPAVVMDDIIGSLKESEEKVDTGQHCDAELSNSSSYFVKKCLNVASDWGRRFYPFPKQVARKIVIEGNGTTHYARNCDHTMGYTVLRERHIRALGWELISVSEVCG